MWSSSAPSASSAAEAGAPGACANAGRQGLLPGGGSAPPREDAHGSDPDSPASPGGLRLGAGPSRVDGRVHVLRLSGGRRLPEQRSGGPPPARVDGAAHVAQDRRFPGGRAGLPEDRGSRRPSRRPPLPPGLRELDPGGADPRPPGGPRLPRAGSPREGGHRRAGHVLRAGRRPGGRRAGVRPPRARDARAERLAADPGRPGRGVPVGDLRGPGPPGPRLRLPGSGPRPGGQDRPGAARRDAGCPPRRRVLAGRGAAPAVESRAGHGGALRPPLHAPAGSETLDRRAARGRGAGGDVRGRPGGVPGEPGPPSRPDPLTRRPPQTVGGLPAACRLPATPCGRAPRGSCRAAGRGPGPTAPPTCRSG